MPFVSRCRPRPPRGAGAVWLAAVIAGCGPRWPDGVEGASIDDARTHWVDRGFVRLEPPIQLPSGSPDVAQTEVWLRLPPEGTIRTVGDRFALRFPPGTEIDRVEFAREGAQRHVADVRGTTIEADDRQRFHVLRPDRPPDGVSLFGVAWDRDDATAHAGATAALLQRLAEVPPATIMDEAGRAGFLASVGHKNACLRCHGFDRPDANRSSDNIVMRGTDASGFYTPATLLVDEAPLESYGAFDPNERDPFVSIACRSGELSFVDSGRGGRRAQCSDGSVPIGRIDLAGALALDDPRARAVCAGRRLLYERLDERGRVRFADGMRTCAFTP